MEDIKVVHNSYEKYYREPFGAVTCGTKIKLAIDVIANTDIIRAELEIFCMDQKHTVKMTVHAEEGNQKTFMTYYNAPENPCLIWYNFVIYIDENHYYYSNNQEKLGGLGMVCHDNPKGYQITVYKPMNIPNWYKESIIYQIYTDRFSKGDDGLKTENYKDKSLIHSNWYDTPFYIKDYQGHVIRWDFFGGNLIGIIDKLDYLKKLGVTAIYLNPIFDSVSNHKYDTGDYKKIDPAYGDDEIFEKFINETKKRNISIILDGVFSHTGSDSIYFNKNNRYDEVGAYQSKDSHYYKWYRFFKYPDKYDCWWGVGTLPNVNEMIPSYLDYIVTGNDSVIKHWFKKGIKGWRLDVADELPDDFIKVLKKVMKETDEESILIGEVWEDASRKESYGNLREYFWGEELDAVMNYPFREYFINYLLDNWDAEYVQHRIMSLYENYPKENFMASMNLIGSHDRIRIMTILGEAPYEQHLSDLERENYRLASDKYQLALKRLKLLSLIQFTFPGVPCIYYGDEAGLQGYSDPYNRGTYPWCREEQELIEWYVKIGKLRNNHDAFRKGEWVPYITEGDVYGYYRTFKETKMLCIFNRNINDSKTVSIPDITDESDVLDLLEDKRIKIDKQLLLLPLQGKVIKIR